MKSLLSVLIALNLLVFIHIPMNAQAAINLNNYTLTAGPVTTSIPNDLSGVTYNSMTNSLFVCINGTPTIYELDLNGNVLRTINMTGFEDTEGLVWIGGTDYIIIEERKGRAVLISITAATTAITYPAAFMQLPGVWGDNLGIEGVTYNPATNELIIIKEKSPLTIYSFVVPATFANPITVTNPFDISVNNFGLSDIAGLHHLGLNTFMPCGEDVSDNYLILSHESAQLIETDNTGTEYSRLDLTAGGANGTLAATIPQAEGVTMDNQGNIYVVSEANLFYKFAPQSVDAGTLSTTSNTTTCAQDGTADVIDVVAGGDQAGDNFGWLITDAATGNILSMGVMAQNSTTFSPDLDTAPAGTCNIYIIAWNGTLTGADQGSNISGITSDVCFELSDTPIAITREDCTCTAVGGTLSTTSSTTTCTQDGTPDIVDAVAGGDQTGDNFGWLITDAATGDILSMGVMAQNSTTFSPDLDPAPPGTCNIYIIAWNGTLTGADQGSNIAGISSDECFELSATPIAVTRDDCTASVPTVSEWGMIILILLLLTLGVVYVRQTQTSLITNNGFNLPIGQGLRVPFERHVYLKALIWTGVIACIAAVCSLIAYGEITLVDIVGTIIAAPIFTYLMHVLMTSETDKE